MNETKISVIIPIYNVEKYLRACLDSIVGQTFKDIEIVLVDDVGNDGSMAIAHEFAEKDNRIKIIHHEKNCKQATARNTGLQNSSAPFVMFCDSDDFYEPEMCEKMLYGIESSGADIAACGIKVIYEPGTEGEKEAYNKYYKIKFGGLCKMNDGIRNTTDCSVCNKIFRRNFLDSNGIQFPDGLYYEDAYFVNACFAVANNIFFIDEYLYNYVRRSGSTMSSTFDQKRGICIDHVKIAVAFNDFLKQHELLEKNKDFLANFFFQCLDFAIRYETDPACRAAIYDLADDFIASEGWHPDNYPAPIAQMFGMLKQRSPTIRHKRMTILERIFSVRNDGDHKVIMFFGIKIKIKRKIRT